MENSKNFNGKVALVTGSSCGIGLATVLYLAKCGAKVVINGRDEECVKKVAQQCSSEFGQNDSVAYLKADVSIESECNKLINLTIEKFGKLDILVNNAGVAAYTSIHDDDLMKKYDQVMNDNLKSVVYLTYLAVPYLEKTKGVIINISSVTSIKPVYKWNAYCMAKSAVDMFTRCLALELGPKGIRVNVINPSAIKTNFFRRLGLSEEEDNKAMEQRKSRYPLRRVGEPDDVAKIIAHLASDDSSYITGTSILIDGGSIWTGTSN